MVPRCTLELLTAPNSARTRCINSVVCGVQEKKNWKGENLHMKGKKRNQWTDQQNAGFREHVAINTWHATTFGAKNVHVQITQVPFSQPQNSWTSETPRPTLHVSLPLPPRCHDLGDERQGPCKGRLRVVVCGHPTDHLRSSTGKTCASSRFSGVAAKGGKSQRGVWPGFGGQFRWYTSESYVIKHVPIRDPEFQESLCTVQRMDLSICQTSMSEDGEDVFESGEMVGPCELMWHLHSTKSLLSQCFIVSYKYHVISTLQGSPEIHEPGLNC